MPPSSPIADTVLRLVANNPGPFTGDGTNTYLIGHDRLAVIDPGPLDDRHLAAVLAAAAGRPITHVLVTHAHRDHVGGLAAMLAATGAVSVGMARTTRHETTGASSPSGASFVDWSFAPDLDLAPGARLDCGDVTLEAVHTPGHAPDHMSFALSTEAGSVLFSGDHVMGWSTSVVAPPEGHMGDYLRSLEVLVGRPERLYLPGHGAPVDDGPRLCRAYLHHRQMREQSVLAAIRSGADTVETVTATVYEGLAPALMNAARLSVVAHLELLAEKALVRFDGPARHAIQISAERPA